MLKKLSLLGCVGLLLLMVVPVLLVMMMPSIVSVVAKLTPLDTHGSCSKQEIADYFATDKLEPFLDALNKNNQTSESLDLNRVNLAELGELRNTLDSREVPTCLIDTKREQVSLADDIISAISIAQDVRGGRMRAVKSALVLAGLGIRLDRIKTARMKITQNP